VKGEKQYGSAIIIPVLLSINKKAGVLRIDAML
jgi:hypothetical protein